jgi:two-component system, chemotaxis family, protein-glutamate methylesterase/glutaminase
VLEKPAGPATPGFEERCGALLQTIRSMAGVKVVRHSGRRPAPAAPISLGGGPGERVRAVAIAGSTGGPAALQAILPRLPEDFPVPILVVQHIARGFVGGLVSWLAAESKIRVQVAVHGEVPAAGTAYLAPDDLQLGLAANRCISLSPEPPVGGFRPSATALFESAGRVLGGGVVCVILTGMGRDGVEGLRRVKALGGRVLAQDEASSVVFGMNGAAIEAGVVDEILAIDDIPGRLLALVAAQGDN